MNSGVVARPVSVTVAISTRDRPGALQRCLAALADGLRLPDELIVVDQSVGDGTHAVVSGAPPSLRTRYIRHDGVGLGASQNVAFRAANSDIVAVTDDDCAPAPEWLYRMVAAFGSAESPAGVAGRVLPLGPDTPGRYPVSLRTATERRLLRSGSPPWEAGSGNNFALRKDWISRIGGNDERLGPGAPGKGGVDIDLFHRLLRAGGDIWYDPGVVVFHERTSKEGRLARRYPYGYGVGAGSAMWWRQGDRQAGSVLRAWVLLRMARVRDGLARGDWGRVREEMLVLSGTLTGVAFGLRQKPEAPRAWTTAT
jgi:GT2 family glycosyltransferase